MIRSVLCLVAALLVALAIGNQRDSPKPPDGESPVRNLRRAGSVQDRRLSEISGMVRISGRPGCYWVHNDSGDGPRIFAVSESGSVIAEVEVAGAFAIDWEDITRGPGTEPDRTYLYLSDTGDNFRIRKDLAIYRIREPELPNLNPGQRLRSKDAEPFRFRFPGGPFDCEAVIAHPDGKSLYCITKSRGRAGVYRLNLEAPRGEIQVLAPVATMSPGPLVTGADLTAKGDRMLLLTERQLHEYTLPANTPFEKIFEQEKTLLLEDLSGFQVEAACYDESESGFSITHEGVPAHIWKAEIDTAAEPAVE